MPVPGQRTRTESTPVKSIESIYWVFTHNCNLRCAHCYNDSRPGAPTITRAEADAVLSHLPDDANRFILSGGEPLVELDLLLHLVTAGRAKYPPRAHQRADERRPARPLDPRSADRSGRR